jgi:3-dehydroquinate synthase/2-deoxy-scyllo-inosose synthase
MVSADPAVDVLRIGETDLTYHHGHQCTPGLGRILSEEFRAYDSVLVLIDQAARAHADALLSHVDSPARVAPVLVGVHEQGKSLDLVNQLMERAVEAGVNRRSAVVALGGGFIGNVAGMVAALLFRGLPLIHLPTSPVAAFDSVLSAKQAVNLRYGKNLCGTFLTPSLIACDLAWLETVPAGEMTTGLAEMAKNVLAVVPERADEFLEAVRRHRDDPKRWLGVLLDIGISAKAPYLARDPQERHEALVFEYGHTVGHAIEFASAGAMLHGEAVAWGMLIAAEVGRRVTGLPAEAVREHQRMAEALGLDRRRLAALDPGLVKGLVAADNKRGYLSGAGGQDVAMVLLEDLGRAVRHDGRPLVAVSPRDLGAAIDAVMPG